MAPDSQPQPTFSGAIAEHLSQRVVHPQDTHTVATAVNDDPGPSHKSNLSDASPADLLFFQARAFLEATEDVDVEPETIQELIQLLTDKEATGKLSSESLELEIDEGDEEDDPEKGLPELDISALFTRKDDNTWSKAEIKSMMHDLKEKGSEYFVRHYVVLLGIPIPKLLLAFGINLCPELRELSGPTMRYFLRVAMFRELRIRERIPQYSTITDAVNLIRNSKRILVLTGAGISVSCGIPDFRSRDGLYASLGEYELDDPQQMFDITYFRENPSVFYSFARHVHSQKFPRNSIWLMLLQVKYTLQISFHRLATDSLNFWKRATRKRNRGGDLGEESTFVPECNAPTTQPKPKKTKKSKKKAKGEWDSDEEDESDAPTYPPGIMKPDITFFGEKLSDEFDTSLEQDRHNVDLLMVIGTSLKVAPVADLLSYLPHSIPQILINKTPIRHINPDIVLLGNADDIVVHLCEQLGWELPPPAPSEPTPVSTGRSQPPRGSANVKKRVLDAVDAEPPRQVSDSHVWLFPGAEGGRWLSELEKEGERRAKEVQGATSDGSTSVPQTRGSSPASANLSREVKKARIT
ncbi:NAD-dependent histone deacetylase sir2 [Marasmius tenuissimus]|nr:NAD-dependent histone deacetylase sir2 [Marasmius tenuissimus]